MSKLQEMIDFWDDFAQEYTTIQNESQTNITQDVIAFLTKQAIFPTSSLLDLAGGSGKYIKGFLPFVEQYVFVDFSKEMIRIAQKKNTDKKIVFLKQDQATFFKETKNQSYDIVFSAMNPALTTQNDLDELLRIAKKRVYLLRLVSDEDLIFSHLEEEYPNLMANYKEWLKRPYHSTKFVYRLEEEVEKAFFFDYFEGEIPFDKLEEVAKIRFKNEKYFLNQRKIVFELLEISTE